MMIYESRYISVHMCITSNSGLNFMPLCPHCWDSVYILFSFVLCRNQEKQVKRLLDWRQAMNWSLLLLNCWWRVSRLPLYVVYAPAVESVSWSSGKILKLISVNFALCLTRKVTLCQYFDHNFQIQCILPSHISLQIIGFSCVTLFTLARLYIIHRPTCVNVRVMGLFIVYIYQV